MLDKTGLLILANLIPTVEQVGGIPLGMALGFDPISSFLISLAVNCSLFFPVYFALELFYDNMLSRVKIFKKYIERTREKGKPYIDKYGVVGLTLFICLPTPLTGTYTATLLSWFLGLDWKKSFLAIAIGSFIGGIIIMVTTVGIFNFLKFLFSI